MSILLKVLFLVGAHTINTVHILAILPSFHAFFPANALFLGIYIHNIYMYLYIFILASQASCMQFFYSITFYYSLHFVFVSVVLFFVVVIMNNS